jgi:3-deoxy-manno-octulosonate cytidylyltransferase (CMP-KDO synthetase)
MRAAIIVPARLQSTRLPNKMLLGDTGKALICHTAETAARIRDLSNGVFAKVIVAADDPGVMAAVEKYSRLENLGVEAVMTDPSHQSGSDRIAEAAKSLPADIDAILNLQGDEPDIPPAGVLALADFYQRTEPDIATLIYPITAKEDRENPALVKAVLGADGRALYFSRAEIPFRRDDGPFAPPTYGHVGIYLYRRAALERFVSLPQGALEQTEKLEQLRALENGMTITALVLERRPPKGIDTPEDYADFVRKIRS